MILEEKQRAEFIKDFVANDQAKEGMDRRASLAEIVLGLVISMILLCTTVAYCKLFNKKKQDKKMEVMVNEQVAQYFALSGTDTMRQSSTSLE